MENLNAHIESLEISLESGKYSHRPEWIKEIKETIQELKNQRGI